VEFPSDNPALWLRAELVGLPPLAEGAHVEEDDSDIEVVEELDFEPVQEHAPVEPEPPTAGPEGDPFPQLIGLLSDVVRESAGGALAPVVAKVLGAERVDDDVPAATAEALIAGGILERAPRGLVRTEAFTQVAVAWSRVLRGESDDIAACGPRMLDEWSADVVARIAGAPGKTEQLRRELRRRGVAAFGLLAAA
jgi:hypothetical protein